MALNPMQATYLYVDETSPEFKVDLISAIEKEVNTNFLEVMELCNVFRNDLKTLSDKHVGKHKMKRDF